MLIFYPGFNPATDQGMFDKPVGAIVNTVNCKGTGKTSRGVAGQVFSRFDGAHKAYMKMCQDGKFFPGAIQMVELNPKTGAQQEGTGFFVFNVATKDDWRNPSDLAWVEAILKKLPIAIERSGVTSIAIPPLGCGEGGLNWEQQVGPLAAKYLSPLEEKGIAMHIFARDPDPAFKYTRSVPPSQNRNGMPVFYPRPEQSAAPVFSDEIWFAGIGARPQTERNPKGSPPQVVAKMERMGELLAKEGWGLRSGAAAGADSAFEEGFLRVIGSKRAIYLPHEGFNGRHSDGVSTFGPRTDEIGKEAEKIALALHPKGEELSGFARGAMTRNAYQLLGYELNAPSQIVICYTHGGGEVGGTGQSLRLARERKIPVLNLGESRCKTKSAEQLVEVAKQMVTGLTLDQALKTLPMEQRAQATR